MKPFELLHRIFVTAGVEPAQYRNIESEIVESNRRATEIFSLVAFVFLTVMFVLTFAVKSLAAERMLYLGISAVTAVIFILAKTAAKKNAKLALVLSYLFMILLLLFGIVLGTLSVPNEITATYIALLLVVPQVFTDRPYRICLMLFASLAAFIVMALQFKDPSTWRSDIVNSVVFGLISMFAGTWVMGFKVRRYALEDTVRHMAETDMLTGLRNRNSYEQRLSEISILNTKSVFCVYVDVNGLHELNNTMGHEAGDRMLQYIATVMQNMFGVQDTYRIGGDEYVAFGTDKDPEQLEKMISKMKQAVEAAGYHVAVGVEHRSKQELIINELVNHAEQKMYADKRAYYSQNGHDRRRR